MATGRRAFDASTEAGLIGAILQSDPPAAGSLPRAFFARAHCPRLLRQGSNQPVVDGARCRARAAGDRGWPGRLVRLAPPGRHSEGLRGRCRHRGSFRRVGLPGTEAFDDAAARRLSIVPSSGTTLVAGEAAQISPDRRQIAFVASDASGRSLLYVRPRDSGMARPLPETDDATHPFWSPDSRSLAFSPGARCDDCASGWTAAGDCIYHRRASGALYGLLLAFALYYPERPILVFMLFRCPRSIS